MLPQLEKLNAGMKEIADQDGVSMAQLTVAWAIAKGTLPIIGVTKVSQVEDAVKAAAWELSAEETGNGKIGQSGRLECNPFMK